MTLERYIVWDLETLRNFFSAGFINLRTGKKEVFVISPYQNDLVKFGEYLNNVNEFGYTLVGFNSLQFDAQIIEYISSKYSTLLKETGTQIANGIHREAQRIINLPDGIERFYGLIPEWNLNWNHIDVYKQCHFDGSAKRTSLKWLEFTMRFPNIESMPVAHDEELDEEQGKGVVKYMKNDVKATAEFFNRKKYETDLRITLSQEYHLNLLNASEPRMAREIFGHLLADQMGVEYRELKERRTYRARLEGKELIFNYVRFKDPLLKGIYEFFSNLSFNPYEPDQNNYGLSKVIKNFKFHNIYGDVGLGGIHACVQPGVYEMGEEWSIEDIDVKSYYPNLGIKNNLYPEHLSSHFCVVYDDIYKMRTKIDKKSPINYIFKIILNSTYGLSMEANNYFHDPKYTFTITINGQLLLLMLAERLRDVVPDIVFYQFNTDGISCGYHPKHKGLVEKVKSQWEKFTKLELENNFYKKMVIMDVNNYLAVDIKGKTKRKGLFGYSLDPEDKETDYHKNPSALIIPKAIEAYFVRGESYKDFIHNSTDIYDFCKGVKVKRDFNVFNYWYNKEKNTIEKTLIPQQVIRYYISTELATLKKKYKPGSKIADNNAAKSASGVIPKKSSKKKASEPNVTELEAGNNCTVFNKYVEKPMKDYGINYNYYIKAVREIVDKIEPNSKNLKLF